VAERTRVTASDDRDRVEEFIDVIEQNAAGDLSARMDEGVDDEALARLAAAYNDMLADWIDRFQTVEEFGSQVDSATRQVTDRVDDVQDASQDVSRSIEEISEGASEQNEYIQDISDEMRNLSATIQEIAASADDVADHTSTAADRGERGREAANEAIAELHELEETATRTVENVERLDELMDEIRDVAAFIDDVAEQTNILALNANIEAARAGQAGSGFAVVADEVKELAEETQAATDEIETSINNVRQQAEDAVADIYETRDSVADGVETVEDVIDALEEIVRAVQEVNDSVQEISDATDTQAESTQEVVDKVDEVGAISEETAAEADTVATAAQAQASSFTEIRTSINTLSERADDLTALLSDIDLSKGGTVGDVRARETGETVTFWHAMSGEKALLLDELAREFEAQSDRDVRLELESKGSYRGTMNAAIDAIESGDPPTITQIFEIGTKQAMDSGGFVPVEQVIPEDACDLDALLDPVLNYYRTDGRLYSMPFNSSNPILCYNADAFAAAGLDPDSPPETFEAVRQAAERIVAEGVADYGITFANYSWFVEQWFAEQNQELVDRRNGRDGTATESYLDSEAAHTIFEWWSGLDHDGLYHNPGIEARGKAKDAFHDEQAAMLIGSTSSLSGIEAGATDAGFEMGTGYVPVPGERHGVLVGGASLWLPEDVPRDQQRAGAAFIGWLTQPEQQARWHKETGYFPIHEDAIGQLEADGWFEENPHFRTAFQQLRETRDTDATNGARIGPFDTVRTMIEEGYEEMSAGQPVEEALDRLADKVDRQLQSYRDDTR